MSALEFGVFLVPRPKKFGRLVCAMFGTFSSLFPWSTPGDSGYSFSRCVVDVCSEVHRSGMNDCLFYDRKSEIKHRCEDAKEERKSAPLENFAAAQVGVSVVYTELYSIVRTVASSSARKVRFVKISYIGTGKRRSRERSSLSAASEQSV